MKNTFVALALAASALASPKPQAVTSAIVPASSAPAGCSPSHDGQFTISVVNVTKSAKRSDEKRQLSGILTLSLAGGILKDQAGRTGYVASNYQFQFDSPPQAGALVTAGFSYCSNNTLALGGMAIWYQCWSGGFFNLYDRKWADHCVPIYLVTGANSAPATQLSDGQPNAPTKAPTPISQLSDGQPQNPTKGPVISQLTDGQPQVPTGLPKISQLSDDNQPQVPTAAPPPPASTPPAPPASAPPAPPASAPAVPPPVSQLSDGQPQAPPKPTGGAPLVSQLSDGQPQAAPATTSLAVGGSATSAPAQFTGAAATAAPMYAYVGGLLGLAALL
ncbi:hypothetical protein BCR34DRAFT_186596 [Clohesyomyces aquaticus]|uniref:Cell wall mannoprotein PIR1-like C-terminal domain-containing protein n=1 Tax=Clohesyomyces aquaticus TaxID=1231657 RepID=A0A1Y1YDL7_9PLEO|nr:hypothetical protein BCR34DRAFT_186596 [Clohesyomyces aquaticus]